MRGSRRVVVGLVIAAGVVAAALVLLGRSGGAAGAPAAQRDAGARPTATGGATPSGAVHGNGGHAGAPSTSAGAGGGNGQQGASPLGGTSGSGTAHPTPTADTSWFTVTLGSTCVVPGGTQTLSAQSRTGYTVAYNSKYADGKTGEAYGGFGVLPTDAQGRTTTRWTVAATAPLGQVTVYAGTANGGPAATLSRTFVIAAHC